MAGEPNRKATKIENQVKQSKELSEQELEDASGGIFRGEVVGIEPAYEAGQDSVSGSAVSPKGGLVAEEFRNKG
jgi:hypothetical protein